MIYRLLRGALFRMDAESAHEFTARQMERLQDIPIALRAIEWLYGSKRPETALRLWGLAFPNRVGIAAGFDKNATMVPFLRALGFGFVEVGTVTLLPQPGNPQPRLFRYPRSRALINRMGFNNDGADAVAARLTRLSNGNAGQVQQPLFVNIGKNRDVALPDAGEAYRSVYSRLAPLAHGVVINVSSPNTPGLRDLQNPGQIAEILEGCREERSRLEFRSSGEHPILVKIAPDLTDSQLAPLVEVCVRLADGIVATNTTTGREGLAEGSQETGGLSGRPLFPRSTDVLKRVRELAGPGYPLIGVGGIFSAEDAIAKIDAGADLVQVYTGFIYEGPGMPSRIAAGLRSRAK